MSFQATFLRLICRQTFCRLAPAYPRSRRDALVQEIVGDPEAALEQFREIAVDLGGNCEKAAS